MHNVIVLSAIIFLHTLILSCIYDAYSNEFHLVSNFCIYDAYSNEYPTHYRIK